MEVQPALSAQLAEALERKRERMRERMEFADTPDALLKIDITAGLTGLSKATVYRRVRDGSFPKPVRLSARCTRWRAGDVMAWLRAMAQQA